MPRAPKGWAWASCIIDSGSSVDSFQNPSVLTAPRPSKRTVQVANGDTVRSQLEGLARIHTYDVAGRPTTVGIPDAVSDSRLKSLLSLGRTQRRGINVNTDDEHPYIELVSGRRLPLRRDGDLCHLDFLVPADGSDGRPPPLADTALSVGAPACSQEAHYTAPRARKLVLDICAGTASMLQYHALDPHAELLAIDPAFCQCCAQSSMQAKSRSNKHTANRPQANSPLGQVPCDIVEYCTAAFGPVIDMHGCKYALVLIDGYSRYAYAVPMRRKSDALGAFKMFVQDVGKPRKLLSDCDPNVRCTRPAQAAETDPGRCQQTVQSIR